MRLAFTLLFIIINLSLFAQKEANIWYFGFNAGLDFNSGEPQVIDYNNVHTFMGTAVINDSAGNLLFYCDGRKVYNRQHNIMSNGDNLFDDDYTVTQRVLIVKLPRSENLYYLFCVGRGGNGTNDKYGLWYSIIDLNQENGLGMVIQRKSLLSAAYDAQEKLTAVKHKDEESIWIITRKTLDAKYAAFLLSANGLNTSPVLSDAPLPDDTPNDTRGYLKVSYDKKYIISGYLDSYPPMATEICRFNDETGEITYLYYILKEDELLDKLAPFGIEFSPDSKLVYIAFFRSTTSPITGVDIYQYDMSKIEDPIAFAQSAILINPGYPDRGPGIGLQLATDGKIYCSFVPDDQPDYYNVSVIHKPWKRGLECSYQRDVIDLGANEVWWSFPNILLDHLFRFEWIGNCEGKENGVMFKPNFNPAPDSIRWVFSDPDASIDSVSTELSPTHYFTHAGDFEVIVDVWYPPTPNNPMGRYEHTSRVITVEAAPEPDLGSDIQICDGASTQLNAGSEPGAYSWSTGAWGPNLNSITVADTGTYWVRVRNNAGCYGSDTIRLTMFPKPVLDTTNLVISPTTCGGSTGAIKGLTVAGTSPINVEWQDVNGNVLETGYDIFNLPVNNYYFYATDGNGCTTLLDHFQIKDAGDILIDTVVFEPSYCGLNNGSITITAVNGLGDMLDYSINNGTNYVHNQWQFNNLSPGSYNIKVTDSSGCQAVWTESVIIQDLGGPVVTPSFTPATGTSADGTVTLSATGFGTLVYTLENITQPTNTFTGLAAGIYHYRVEDENGCFTEGDIEVESIMGITLTAIAGNGQACMGTSVRVPVKVKNFTGVKGFSATLNYDPTDVSCLGPYPGSIHNLLSALNFIDYPSLGRIVATWDSAASVTIQDTALLFELVFKSTNPGSSLVTWDQAPSMTWFSGENGNIDDIEFTIGQVHSVNPPEIIQDNPKVCEGDMLVVNAIAIGEEPLTYEMQLPNGKPHMSSVYLELSAKPSHAGPYTIKVTDAIGCADTAVFNVTVVPPPNTNFPETHIPFENQYTLEAPQGYASYEWSNGETNYFITVTEEGEYSVIIKTTEGCESRDTAMLVNVTLPVYVPNAFTPNGDGLNDTFKPIITKPDLISQYHLSIYNRWGQCFFE
ncbi:MAG TPA: gliding motility-associated C-terminal domain-containing protein, partial [Lentimicrobium sp.]|nr:gliding motility-associated C-terminal domain-containing protein [Lentimicrobium sp.]